MTNPYDPPETVEHVTSEQDASIERTTNKANQRKFRYRVIPSALCLLIGVPLICMSAFWGYQVFDTTIDSEMDTAFRLVPPVLFVGMSVSGSAFILGSRYWIRGRWKIAVASTMLGWGFVYGAYRIAAFLVPEAA